MKIAEFLPHDDTSIWNRDIIAILVILSASVYAAIGGFKAVVKTDQLQWLLAAIAIFATFFVTLPGITSASNLFGSVYAAQSFNWKDFLLIPTQPYFIVGSLFSWGFWFFVTMDMWQRAASARTVAVINNKARVILYPWFVILSTASVCIGLYVRVNSPGNFGVYFPVVDFLNIAFSAPWSSEILKWVVYIVIFNGFLSAMISTIDSYILVVAHSIYRDINGTSSDIAVTGDTNQTTNVLGGRFNRFFVAFLIFGVALVVIPLFFLVSHTNFSINSLLYLATSLPFVLLPSILFKFIKKNASSNIVLSVIFGLTGTAAAIFYVLYQISLAQAENRVADMARFYDYMYLAPMCAAGCALIGYVLGFVVRSKDEV